MPAQCPTPLPACVASAAATAVPCVHDPARIVARTCVAYTQNVVLPHGARVAIRALDETGDPAQAAVAQLLREGLNERHS